jgi:DNA-binding transcriptional LysR family regulator
VINLHRLDLNLLRTLDVLLSENNVTRAAQRLNLSQPSVSIQLARLREILPTRCCCRAARMLPTARADELRGPLRDALTALELAVAPASHFDPATAAQTWRVAATDIWPRRFCSRRCTRCVGLPGSRLAVFELQPSRLVRRQSVTKWICFSIPATARRGAASAPAVRERYVLAGGRGIRRCGALSLAQFCQLEQVIVSPDGGGFSRDRYALANLGLARRVVLSCHISCLCWRRCAIAIWWRCCRSGWCVG